MTLDLFKDIIDNDAITTIGLVVGDTTDTSQHTPEIFVQTSEMKKSHQLYQSVLFLDVTYKVNNRQMLLYTLLLLVDSDLGGQVIGLWSCYK